MVLRAPRNDMGANQRGTVFDGAARTVSGTAGRVRGNEAARSTTLKAEVRDIANQNYGEALRKCLSRAEVREIADEGKTRVWPGLNRQPVTLVTLDEFVRRWSAFGVDFKFASLPWKQGLSLLGFYVKRMNRAPKRPLIFVNTAHHRALVGAALDHEMGHHLTTQIFGCGEEHTHLLSPTAFKEHLAEPAELAADVLVSLGIFPAPIAQAFFDPANDGAAANARGLSVSVFAKVLEYIAESYDLRVEQIRQSERKSQALAALVHYTKLRRALLDEYDT